MGFEFGVLRKLDHTITLYCFIAVVAFVILVEYVLGIMEYFLEGSRLYSKMVKMIYKELMLMGMLTFCVMMIEAVPKDEGDVIEEEWLASIDFSHVYLFFVTFFFVMHAFYLMMMSVSAVTEYRLMFSERTSELIESLQAVKKSCIGSFLFYRKLFPLSTPRYHAEFSLIQALFLRLYRLPEDLDFPYYLSGCFDRFALATINRSMFTWVVLLFLVVCNYARIRYNLTRRVLVYVYTSLDWEVPAAAEISDQFMTTDGTLLVFFICGVLLVLYTILLTLISRVYKARLVDKVYPDHHSIDDHISVLRAKLDEQTNPNETVRSMRLTSAALRKEIEMEFDAREDAELEDSEGVRFLAEALRRTYLYVDDLCTDISVYLKVKARELCCYPTPASNNRSASLLSAGAAGKVGKKVSEAKAVHVSLKQRLKFTLREKDAFRSTRSTERDGLLANRRGSNGMDDRMPSYGAVPTSDPDDEGSPSRGTRAGAHRSGSQASPPSHSSCAVCASLCCCSCCTSDWEGDSMNAIFCAGRPIWYFRAVELQIMFTCMYMALWATNFVTTVRDQEDYSLFQECVYQFLMVLPILFAFKRIAFIAETYALILAICDINIEVLYEVLVNTEDMAVVANELRGKINEKIRAWAKTPTPSAQQERLFVHLLFEEVDQDGSGAIDKSEFRALLKKLNLSYSDHRFNLLFRAVDSIGGDGTVEEEDLVEFMFPSIVAAEDGSAPAAGTDEERGEVVVPRREHAAETRPTPSPSKTPTTASVPAAAPRAYTAAEREALIKRAAEIRADIAASRQLSADPSFVASVAAGDFRSTGGNWTKGKGGH